MDGQKLVIWRVLLIAFAVSLGTVEPANALDSARSILQMFHRAYTRDDGLPGAVNAITQTPDGYLWVGTASGLYRFDGVRFERVGDDRTLAPDISLMETAVNFTIAPTFVQSIWFRILAGLVLAGLVRLAYALRLRQETARLQSGFDVRIAERERIARELHDSLLQGCQGLLLRFQSIANRVPAGDGLRDDIEDALNRADAVLAEGRARVRDLRSTATGDFAQSLAEAASDIITGDMPRFHLTVEGEQRALNVRLCEKALRNFEEAIRNVLKHANAKRIDARLQISSREGAGTEVVMRAPSHVAYKKRRLWPLAHHSLGAAGETA